MPSHPTIPWPDHWYCNNSSIKCQAHGCAFTTQPTGLIKQLEDMKRHCAETPGVEHAIFMNMLNQRGCVTCSYTGNQGQASSNRLRKLFAHEKDVHDSDSMSRMCGYIVLARKGRINGRLGQESRKLAFDRMVERLQGFEQPVTQLLCQMEGVPHSLANLQHILSTDYLQPDRDSTAVWLPVPADRFLWLLRPDSTDPANRQWAQVWARLRQMYRNGHL